MREADPLTQTELGPPQILCYGELLFDLMENAQSADLQIRSDWTPYVGGAPSNVASCLSALSVSTALLSNVGDDPAGKHLRESMEQRGVNTDAIVTLPQTKTRQIFVRRDEEGERTFVGFDGDNSQFADAMRMEVDDIPGVLFYAARMFVTGTMGLAFQGSAKTARELAQIASDCKLTVAIDVNWRPMIWQGWDHGKARESILQFLLHADVVKASIDDIAFLFGEQVASVALHNPQDVLSAMGKAARRGILVTAGEQGASYAFRSPDGIVTGRVQAVSPTRVVDTTGAGDAFLAAFLSQLLREGGEAALSNKEKVDAIVKFASGVAGVAVAGEGAVGNLGSHEQIEDLVSKWL